MKIVIFTALKFTAYCIGMFSLSEYRLPCVRKKHYCAIIGTRKLEYVSQDDGHGTTILNVTLWEKVA